MEDHYQYSYDPSLEFPQGPLPLSAPSDIFAIKADHKTPEELFHVDDFVHEATFHNGYMSDEEVDSPTDIDVYSVGSSNSDIDSGSIMEPFFHAQSYDNMQERCQAQAVQVVSVGKAKVVTMPKVVDASLTEQATTPPNSALPPARKLTSERIADFRDIEPDTGYWRDSRSSYETLPDPPPELPLESPLFGQTMQLGSVRRRPGLSRLQVQPSPEPAEWFSSTKTEFPSRNVSFAVNNTLPSDSYSHTIVPSTTSKLRFRKLSISLGITGIKKSFRRSHGSDSSSNGDSDSMKQTNRLKKSSAPSDAYIPPRASSKPARKMIARGANERAPPIVLPPCPDDYEENILFKPQWPLRNASIAAIQPLEPRTEKLKMHNRRKSLSAFVSTSA